MAKRERKDPISGLDPETAQTPIRRLSIPLNDDGTLAADRMRIGTRDELAKLLTAPGTARALGVAANDAPAVGPIFPRELALAITGTIAQLDLLVLVKLTGAPPALVLEHGAWSVDERNMIEPAIQRLLDKHLGQRLSQWADEAALVMALVSLTTAKAAAIRAAQSARRGPASVVTLTPKDTASVAADDASDPLVETQVES